ncbi:MAG: hypothetical protein M3501_06270 [Actinomycetota bacterium]|nr:hypothetical protein [Actinomycetota bacterium]
MRSSSDTRRRARSTSPLAASAATRAIAGSLPSATSSSTTRSSSTAPNAMRTQREAIVTSSGGTKSAQIRKIVDAGGSSIDFSRIAAASGRTRWNSFKMSTLRSPSTGAIDDCTTTSRACSAEMPGPTRWNSWMSGCSPAEARRIVRSASRSGVAATRTSAANARAATSFVDPDGPTRA